MFYSKNRATYRKRQDVSSDSTIDKGKQLFPNEKKEYK